jgi:hypothetical protein
MQLLKVLVAAMLIAAACVGCGGNKAGNNSAAAPATINTVVSGGEYPEDPTGNMSGGTMGGNMMSNMAAGNSSDPTGNYTSGGSTPTKQELVYCPRIQDRATAADCSYYEEVWVRLERGQAAIDTPPHMVRGISTRVSFAINRADAGVSAEELLDSAPEQTAQIRVGRRMAVQLQGEGFTVEPQGLMERDLGPGGAERWDWTVTPQRRGRLTLTFSAYVVIQPSGGERTQSLLRTLTREVEVSVRPADLTKDAMKESKAWFELTTGWLVALTALIGTGLLGLWLAIRKWRDRNKPPVPDQAAVASPPASPPPPPPV